MELEPCEVGEVIWPSKGFRWSSCSSLVVSSIGLPLGSTDDGYPISTSSYDAGVWMSIDWPRASNMRSSIFVGSDVPAVKLRFLGTDLSDDDDERLLKPTRRAVRSLCMGSESK